MAKLWEGIQNIFAPVVGFFTGIWESIKESFGSRSMDHSFLFFFLSISRFILLIASFVIAKDINIMPTSKTINIDKNKIYPNSL
ncbi:MAG: hypothetical protein E7218_05640 [Anaerofustis stercorihominis]|nr:hypothetical protein [Anaerofustis stercorihominis]